MYASQLQRKETIRENGNDPFAAGDGGFSRGSRKRAEGRRDTFVLRLIFRAQTGGDPQIAGGVHCARVGVARGIQTHGNFLFR